MCVFEHHLCADWHSACVGLETLFRMSSARGARVVHLPVSASCHFCDCLSKTAIPAMWIAIITVGNCGDHYGMSELQMQLLESMI